MTKKQRESVAKYLYDISKGFFLITVVGNIAKGEFNLLSIVVGVIATLLFFLWGYMIEGGGEKDG